MKCKFSQLRLSVIALLLLFSSTQTKASSESFIFEDSQIQESSDSILEVTELSGRNESVVAQSLPDVSTRVVPADWIEVPNSYSENYGFSSYINKLTFSVDGDEIVFEAIYPTLQYAQTEGNCTTRQYRFLRLGQTSDSGIITSQRNTNLEWQSASEDRYKDLILAFGCSFKSN